MARREQNKKRGSDSKPDKRNNISPSATPAEDEYSVGPGRPPKEYQWKPGQSGNPKGAKRKKRSLIPELKEQFERIASQKVKVTQGERQRFITMWVAGMQQLFVQFAKGDRHARRDVFWVADRLGFDFLTPRTASGESLPADRQAILDAYVARRTGPMASSAPSPILAPPELLDDEAPDEDGGK
jgi:hypothetical protein